MFYDYTNDIYDVIEDSENRYSETRIDNLLYKAGECIYMNNGGSFYYGEVDSCDAIAEEAANIIHLWAISRSSTLYRILLSWYGSMDKLMDSVRDCFVDHNVLYFVTGCGYAIFDKDLFGGNGDGTAEKKFRNFIEKGKNNE